MNPAVKGPRVEPTVKLRCHNCGHDVEVRPTSDRAHCTYCSNVWNWKTKQLIRGQR